MYRCKKIYVAILITCCLLLAPISEPLFGVIQVQAATIKLSKSNVALYVGNTTVLQMNGTKAKVTWKSADTKVATVSSKGKVTGVKKGSTTITAAIGTKKYQCKVTVKTPTMNKSSISLVIGENYQLKINGIKGKVKWKSTDNSVAIVNENGFVFSAKEGKSTIKGTYHGKTYSCQVTVVKKKLQVNVKDITLSSAVDIMITAPDLTNDQYVYYEVEDPDILDCKWGEWYGEDINLTLIPKTTGKTKITIYTDNSDDKIVIPVTVVNEKRPKKAKLDAEAVYEKCSAATVQVNTDQAIGSGFFIDEGVVATNYHVIKGAININIQLQNGEIHDVAYILGYSANLDIALLYIPIETSVLPINPYGVKVGETVYAIGSPLGLTDTFTNGIISNVSRHSNNVEYIQTNAAITHGNSGGPLINAYGEVVGINTLGFENGQNLNFAINIRQLYLISKSKPITVLEFSKSNLNEIIENPEVSGAFLTCQQLPSKCGVGGVIESDEIDCYKIELSEPSRLLLTGIAKTNEDTDNIVFAILDEAGDLVTFAENSYIDNNKIKLIDYDLPAGTYYICVGTQTFVNRIPYYFVLYY